MGRDRGEKTEAVRITTAASSRNVDIAARQRRYLLSMSLRTICFVGAVAVSFTDGPQLLMWILIAGALVLPYIAVVMANAVTSRPEGFELQQGGPVRPALTSGGTRTEL